MNIRILIILGYIISSSHPRITNDAETLETICADILKKYIGKSTIF